MGKFEVYASAVLCWVFAAVVLAMTIAWRVPMLAATFGFLALSGAQLWRIARRAA